MKRFDYEYVLSRGQFHLFWKGTGPGEMWNGNCPYYPDLSPSAPGLHVAGLLGAANLYRIRMSEVL